MTNRSDITDPMEGQSLLVKWKYARPTSLVEDEANAFNSKSGLLGTKEKVRLLLCELRREWCKSLSGWGYLSWNIGGYYLRV